MSATKLWKSDDELFAIVQRELFTCVVGDVMDKLESSAPVSPAADSASPTGHGGGRAGHAGARGGCVRRKDCRKRQPTYGQAFWLDARGARRSPPERDLCQHWIVSHETRYGEK